MVIHIWLFVLGAAAGSFSLVLAWRMHDKKDWVKGRSCCDSCGKTLEPKDLIPIVSWLSLKGKCRYCKKPISAQVILSELMVGVWFLVSYVLWPYDIATPLGIGLFTAWLFILVVYNALFWYDLRWYILPNKLVYPAIFFSVIFALLRATISDSVASGLLSALIAAAVLFGFFWSMHTVSKGKWIGFGDVRLAWSLGLVVGSLLQAWLMLFTASVLGILFALPDMLRGNRKLQSKIPFGPMLILATIIVLLIGERLVDWYRTFAGL